MNTKGMLEAKRKGMERAQHVIDYMAEHEANVKTACEALSVPVHIYYRWVKEIKAPAVKKATNGRKAARKKGGLPAVKKATHPHARELAQLLDSPRPAPKPKLTAMIIQGDAREVADVMAAFAAKGGGQ